MAPRAKRAPAGKTQTSSVTTPKAPAPVNFTKEQELHAYREMLMIRRFEEKAGQLYGMGFIGGFCHLYIGQEAVVVGMQTALKEGDQIITSYRDHGHMLATGMEARGVMAELTGRRGGYSKGKGGSMHMFSKEKGFTAVTVSSALRFHLVPVLPLRTSIAAMTTFPSPISAMARPIRARSTKPSTWHRCGSSR